MKQRIMTMVLVASLVAGTAYTMWSGQTIPKAEAETSTSDGTPTTWPMR